MIEKQSLKNKEKWGQREIRIGRWFHLVLKISLNQCLRTFFWKLTAKLIKLKSKRMRERISSLLLLLRMCSIIEIAWCRRLIKDHLPNLIIVNSTGNVQKTLLLRKHLTLEGWVHCRIQQMSPLSARKVVSFRYSWIHSRLCRARTWSQMSWSLLWN